uniref:Uncharacterized protein n=1 Tax=Tetranychus urticae TaxID=32264 RepID=T1L2C9_TETUR
MTTRPRFKLTESEPNVPTNLMLSARRCSSGIFISNMFSSRFRHLQKLHTESFMLGLNAVAYPDLPKGTIFRSSLPATPVSTPVFREGFQHFTEQTLKERLSKNRTLMPHDTHSLDRHRMHQFQQRQQLASPNDDNPYRIDERMDTSSPLPSSSILDDPLIEGCSDMSESESLSLPSTSKRKGTKMSFS